MPSSRVECKLHVYHLVKIVVLPDLGSKVQGMVLMNEGPPHSLWVVLLHTRHEYPCMHAGSFL